MIYFFGPVKKFNVFGAFNKKKLQAEDLITLNLVHKNNIISNLKATTRADRDYRMSMDVLCDKGRYLIKDISLNKIFYFTKTHLKIDKLHSEHFPRGLGPKSGMGNGHKKILKESQLAYISIKKIKKIDELLEDNKILKNTLNIRNAYLDPLSLIQITLMKKMKMRKLNSVENNSLLLSVNGLAAGLRNTG